MVGLQIWDGPRTVLCMVVLQTGTVLIGVWLGSRLCACWRFVLWSVVDLRLLFLGISLSFPVWASFHLLLRFTLSGKLLRCRKEFFVRAGWSILALSYRISEAGHFRSKYFDSFSFKILINSGSSFL